MKKQKGLGLIGILIIIGALILTAGGVVVWEKRLAQPTPTPTPTPVTITPQPTPITTPLPSDIRSKQRLTVVYSSWWFGACGQSRETYSKVGNLYKSKREVICPPEMSNQPNLKTEKEISKEEFEKSVYVQSYLAQPWEQRSFAKIDKSSLASGLNLHPDSTNCWRSIDKVDLVCANKQEIIVDHFWDYNAIGVFDKNSRCILEAINFE